MTVKGRVWKFKDDIDTDQIYPGKYLPLTDKNEMAKHAMEGTEIGAEFLKDVKKGDIIVAGKNFGCGSSREHATVAIKGTGVSVVIARSFARIFHRNAVNTGLPIIELKEADEIAQSDILEVNCETGEIKNITQDRAYKGIPLSSLEMDIMKAGGLLEYLKKEELGGL
ncbi:MAG TPA: 3-isopropylmalate dehydratase small subunit [candidate division WOR-3 bacterium]|uniref:3-isopropylmalate dehydratase small subunit n=1 Tax=candidate division WOR-3 bacterium TaxID=2052148 RepID=A0A9C9EL05_UNCW3|nr:3-isopropylmalate dehydratase small subunit [candidate division WOR-3 bacterium]